MAAIKISDKDMWLADTRLSDFCRGHGVINEEREATQSAVPKVGVASLFLVRPQIPCMTKVLKCFNQLQSLSEMNLFTNALNCRYSK